MLGPPVLLRHGRPVRLRSRKVFPLLAYLALEGPQPRERLADLLWDSPRARSNLRVELHHMEALVPGLVTRLGGGLALGTVAVDARALLRAEEQGRLSAVHRLYRGPFLDLAIRGLTADLEEWILDRRQRFHALWRAASLALARRAQGEAALSYLRPLWSDDPLDGEAVRMMMGFLLRMGEPARALQVFHEHAKALERELGVPPDEATRKLAEQLRAGGLRAPGAKAPVFAGRERELAWLAEAVGSGGMAFVVGEPGIGKTRLLEEFVRRLKGPHLWLEGRPGDADVPFASLARALKRALGLGARPEPGVRRALAAFLPELGPVPRKSSPHRLRAALERFFAPFKNGDWVWLVDDLQYLDEESLRLLLGLLPEARVVLAYRTGTLPPLARAWTEHAVVSGRARMVWLGPLPPAAVVRMLGVDRARAADLARYTGGNPFFLTQLGGRRGVDAGADLRQLVRATLAAEPQPAQALMELATVAGATFNLPLAAEVLGLPLGEVAEAADGLERAGLFRRGVPAHDLIVEAVRETLPAAGRRRWHARLAQALAEEGVFSPAEVAHHFLEAGLEAEAARFFMAAAERSERGAAFRVALKQYEKALALAPPERRLAYGLASLDGRYRMLLALHEWEELKKLLDRADVLARLTGDPVLARRHRLGCAGYRFARGELKAALAETGALLEEGSLPPAEEATARYIQAAALQGLGDPKAALEEAQKAVQLHPDQGWELRGWAHNTAALCLLRMGKTKEAAEQNRIALRHFEAWGQLDGQANALRVFAEIAAAEGDLDRARAQFEEAIALARRSGSRRQLSYVLVAAVRFYREAGEGTRARALAAEGAGLGGPYQAFFEVLLG